MARTVRVRVTGRAEAFIEHLHRVEGLNDREIIAKSLWLLEQAYSGDVAAVDARGQILHFFATERELAEVLVAPPA